MKFPTTYEMLSSLLGRSAPIHKKRFVGSSHEFQPKLERHPNWSSGCLPEVRSPLLVRGRTFIFLALFILLLFLIWILGPGLLRFGLPRRLRI